TDDVRPGLTYQGVQNIASFVNAGGVFLTVENTADFAVTMGLANGVSMNTAARLHVVGSLLRTKIVDDASPIVYGIPDSLAVYSDGGQTFSITNVLGTPAGRRADAS